MTSELTALRRTLTPVIEKICDMWLALHGYDCSYEVNWDDINLQDEVEEAQAELYRSQAERNWQEMKEKEGISGGNNQRSQDGDAV